MCSNKKYPLSLNGDTFNAFKSDFDQMLRQLLTEMEKRESEEATVSIKMVVSLEKDQERDFEANGYDAMKDITKPKFKHEISTVMQVKNKKSGSLAGNMKLVWDRELCQYVMQEIDNGQTSFFDGEKEGKNGTTDEGKTPALPSGQPVIDADYEVIEEHDDGEDVQEVEDEEDGSAAVHEVSGSPFDYMKEFVGVEMKVAEAMGNYTVRTAENKVILSSAFNATDRFYCSAEKLKDHVGHAISCISYAKDNPVPGDTVGRITIECDDCDVVLFEVDAPEDPAEDYPYNDPDEEQGEE